MGRSVSTHRHAIETVYLHFDPSEDEDDISDDWGCFLDDLRSMFRKMFPSMRDCDRWQDREDHVILENQRGEISVSEYCNIVAICIAPRNPDDPFDQNWCGLVSNKFQNKLFNEYPTNCYHLDGRMSNGEAVFRRVGA